MPFDLARLRVERFQAEVGYHATWTFFGLRGILGESWAHGPIFGAFTDVGTGQVNLNPPPDADQRITAVAGVRASGLLAEGPHWTSRAPEIAQDWLRDVLDVLKPQPTVNARVSSIRTDPGPAILCRSFELTDFPGLQLRHPCKGQRPKGP